MDRLVRKSLELKIIELLKAHGDVKPPMNQTDIGKALKSLNLQEFSAISFEYNT
jgi:hypothetical protein